MLDLLTLGIFPYVALVLALGVGIYRYRTNRYSYSTLSSQFLENKTLFWGSIPWHYGIVGILLGHIFGFLFPGLASSLIGSTGRLYVVETVALIFGLLTVVGLLALVARRITNERVMAVTSKWDVLLLVLLLIQVILGVYVAIFYRWGSAWYVNAAVPYLWSLFSFNPNLPVAASLPVIVKLHIINAFALVAVLPFTRLVHLLSFPFSYMYRQYQVVVWFREKGVSGSAK